MFSSPTLLLLMFGQNYSEVMIMRVFGFADMYILNVFVS